MIRNRRAAGEPPPWTGDSVFQHYRFCNLFREDDKTTVWFRDNIRNPLAARPAFDLVLATLTFRWFNRIETAELIKDLLLGTWNEDEARRRLRGVQPIVTGAYMVHTPPGMDKLEGILYYVDSAIPRLRDMELSWGTLQECHADLLPLEGMGRFTAYEVVTDLRWTRLLRNASDIMTWASAGPGCARGIGWVFQNDPTVFNYTAQRDQEIMQEPMRELLAMSQDSAWWPQEFGAWEMREVEHWACEFDKYKRGVMGGRLKRTFSPR